MRNFNIADRDKIERGELVVVDGHGFKVEIKAWDVPGEKPILALTFPTDGNSPIPLLYTKEGHYYLKGENKGIDLFVRAPKRELTRAEEALLDFFDKAAVCKGPDEIESAAIDASMELAEIFGCVSPVTARPGENLPVSLCQSKGEFFIGCGFVAEEDVKYIPISELKKIFV